MHRRNEFKANAPVAATASEQSADCALALTEEDLWSGIDRNDPKVVEHAATCPSCRKRAGAFQATIAAVADASRPEAPPLPEHIGSYPIKRRLGVGGMGIVYEGEQQTPRRPVALKVVHGGRTADEYHIRLFQREAQTLAKLRHPAIAAIYEAGQTPDGQHFFAMELVRGVPLNDYVRGRDMPRRRRLELFGKVCEAINYAHQRGVIHRDLKPSNILVGRDDQPKILDFGLARITDADAGLMSTMTDVGRLMGTLPYMSPEEARGNHDEIDIRSDVYSLGVILYEMLTGELPYAVRRSALQEAVRIICEEPPRRPASIDRSLRGDLETIVLKALEKDRTRRYQSCAALGEDIRRCLKNEPILARRAGGLYHFQKFVMRHRLVVMFAAACFVLVTGARMWVDWLARGNVAATESLIGMQDLRVAIIEHTLAQALHRQGLYNEAESNYRNALNTLRTLQDNRYGPPLVGQAKQRIGPVLVGLGTLLIQRPDSNDALYETAELLLEEALVLFEERPRFWIEERRRALEGLRRLYEIWDLPEWTARIDERLKALDAPPPPPAG